MYTELKLNETTLRVVEAAKEVVTVAEGSSAATLPKDFYFTQAAAAGFEKETLDSVEQFRADFAAGVTLVGGERAIEIFKGNKELTGASIEAEMGKDSLLGRFTRHKTGVIKGGPAAGKEWEKFCSPLVTIRTQASAKSSQLGRVFKNITERAATELK